MSSTKESIPEIRLIIKAGPDSGHSAAFDKPLISLGRGADNDFVIETDSTVSDRHASLCWSPPHWYLKNGFSKNGTHIDDDGTPVSIEGQTVLHPNQTFYLGSTQIVYGEITPSTTMRKIRSRGRETLVLRATLGAGKMSFDLGTNEAYTARFTAKYRENDVLELNRHLEALNRNLIDASPSDPDAPETSIEHLHRLGSLLSEHMVPKKLRQALERSTADSLLLVHDAQLAHIPWELTDCKGDPWCLKFEMGRQVIVDDYSVRLQDEKRNKSIKIVIAANPTEDLPDAQDEAEALLEQFQAYAPRVETTMISGRRVTRLELLRRMEESDIVYYIGHAEYDGDNPEQSAWLLKDDRLDCAALRNLKTPPTLVFSNACESGRETPPGSENAEANHAQGIASSLVLSGAGACIGARWPLTARAGAFFAETFFCELMKNVSIGNAMRKARLKSIHALGQEDMAWASYVLYGNPDRKLL